MSETHDPMTEFRMLEERRNAGNLSAEEELRWQELAVALGLLNPDGSPAGYYGEDGNWYPYAATGDGDPNAYAQSGYYGEDGNWYAYEASSDVAGFAPLPAEAVAHPQEGYTPGATLLMGVSTGMVEGPEAMATDG